MKNELLDTEEKRVQAIALLTTLLGDPGWLWYKQVLAENIKAIDIQIDEWMNDENNTDKAKIKDLKMQRYYQIQLMEHPQKLLEELTTKNSVNVAVSPDPYYTADNIKETYPENQPKQS